MGYRVRKRCLPESFWTTFGFNSSPTSRRLFPPSPAELLCSSFPLAAGIPTVCNPAHLPGVANSPCPALSNQRRPALFPDRELRARACARAPARSPARRRERALCGRCRHVVVVVRRRQRRRSNQTRRSSGPGAAPRRPWLGASWVGGGGRAVAGLAMSCRPVRRPRPPPSLLQG